MRFPKTVLLSLIFILPFVKMQAQVTNSSYVTKYGEKALQLSIIVPLSRDEAWKLFTTDSGLKRWMAPVVNINMKMGGWIRTNYDKTKTTKDPGTIQLNIINYLEDDLLTLKVNLNSNFPKEAIAEDKNLQEVIQLVDLGNKRTKIISTMIGWGEGSHWDKTYSFFEKGNNWTFEQVLKLFK